MEKSIVTNLINCLQENFPAIDIDKNLFSEVLDSIKTPALTEAYEIKSKKYQLIQEKGVYHYFLLKTIINNKFINEKGPSLLKSLFKFHRHNKKEKNPFYTKLKENKTLINLIKKCPEPFSILGELQTYDFNNPKEVLYILTKPILVIPESANTKMIRDWEDKNTNYEEEGGFIRLRIPIKSTKEQYDKRMSN